MVGPEITNIETPEEVVIPEGATSVDDLIKCESADDQPNVCCDCKLKEYVLRNIYFMIIHTSLGLVCNIMFLCYNT